MIKYTVGMVNYKTFDLISYHCRVFDVYCDNFELLVWDNEHEFVTDEFSELMKRYKFLRVIPSDRMNRHSYSHGVGLNGIMSEAAGERIFFCDPDFFYMKKNVLKFFDSFFDDGYRAVGTVFWSHPFPMPWGAAYILDDIKDLDLRSKHHYCHDCEKWLCDMYYDTAFRIRIRLGNTRYMSFGEVVPHCLPDFGWRSNFRSQSFVHDGYLIAHHLKEGSQMQGDLLEVKKKYCDWFWENLKD